MREHMSRPASRQAGARFPEPVLITTTEALAACVERLRAEPFVTVDTEFVRERTYWPELCVVQLAGAGELHHAQLGPVGAFAHEFGIDRDERFRPQALHAGGERLGGGDQHGLGESGPRLARGRA